MKQTKQAGDCRPSDSRTKWWSMNSMDNSTNLLWKVESQMNRQDSHFTKQPSPAGCTTESTCHTLFCTQCKIGSNGPQKCMRPWQLIRTWQKCRTQTGLRPAEAILASSAETNSKREETPKKKTVIPRISNDYQKRSMHTTWRINSVSSVIKQDIGHLTARQNQKTRNNPSTNQDNTSDQLWRKMTHLNWSRQMMKSLGKRCTRGTPPRCHTSGL